MAGLKPHHRIAIGVSGGPDSMALCFLTAGWKTDGANANAVGKSDDGFINGILGVIVDHGLREESNEEAHIVSSRVTEMGIRCEIAKCSWLDGKPKQGHLLEEAREKRYEVFQNVCTKHQIEVLLIAHHADDQAELFILRLSRNSGVLGLAGMAFTSQIFSKSTHLYREGSKNKGILIVRPLLHFSKEILYKICQESGQDWVEDPTNQNTVYARNRIRMSLGNFSSYTFQSELQGVISACRRTRAYVDQICNNLINQAVTIIDQHGYAIVDLEILNPSKVTDICLSKFVALILQYVSQRNRPIRGSTSKLLLHYIRTVPCKTSFTAAGCYLCPAPRSRGTKILVCCSVDCPLNSKMELIYPFLNGEQKQYFRNELEQIIADGKSYSNHFVPDASDVHFLDASESVISEAKTLNIISESTYRDILLLKRDEIKHFKLKAEDKVDYKSKNKVESIIASPSELLQPGKACYFMNRFWITWKLSNHVSVGEGTENSVADLGGETQECHSCSCGIGHDKVAEVRRMSESDWLYLAKLSKCPSLDNLQQQKVLSSSTMEQISEKRSLHLENLELSAQKALEVLKSIPVAARRSLPVLVNHQGLLLSIPSIGFKHCPCLTVSCEFKPLVPLGGGHSSFM